MMELLNNHQSSFWPRLRPNKIFTHQIHQFDEFIPYLFWFLQELAMQLANEALWTSVFPSGSEEVGLQTF